jgi:hypothetical protein
MRTTSSGWLKENKDLKKFLNGTKEIESELVYF